jgi:tetratricopeptide (TPR) repeat protein
MFLNPRDRLLRDLLNADLRQARELVAAANLSTADAKHIADQIVQEIRKYRKDGPIERLAERCKIVVAIGRQISNPDIEGQGFAELGRLYLYPPKGHSLDLAEALRFFSKAQETLSGSNSESIQDLLAENDFYLGQIKRQQGEFPRAIEHLEKAVERFRAIEEPRKADIAAKELEAVRRQLEENTSFVPGDSETVQHLQSQLEEYRAQLAEEQARHQHTQATLDDSREKHKAVARDLEQHMARLGELQAANQVLEQELAEERVQHRQAQATLDELHRLVADIRDAESHLNLLRLSRHAPLWVAAARAELTTGKISPMLLPLLDKLKAVLPQEAAGITAEIAARSKDGADLQPEPSTSADAEHYLHWAVARARFLEKQGKTDQALEMLLKGWETYLEQTIVPSEVQEHA